MAERKDNNVDASAAEEQRSTPAVEPSTTPPATGAHPRSGSTLSPSRPLYIPQFTAATQMILQRMRGEQSNLSSALASASATTSRTSIKASTYEDVRRRVVMTMSTSSGLTMQMPAPPPPTASVARTSSEAVSIGRTPGKESAIRRLSAGLVGRGPSSSKETTETSSFDRAKTAIEKIKAKSRTKASGKRKRGKDDDSDDDTSSLSSLSDPFSTAGRTEKASSASAPPPTTTKSGRQVLKPTTYDPAAMDAAAARKRAHYGKRTAEQQLCKVCTRLASPDSNQMVFCDGCNDGWHQMCHDPWISDEVVRDPSKSWFCAGCAAKREGSAKKKVSLTHAAASPTTTGDGSAGWAVPQTPGQKRAYLSSLSKEELVDLLMRASELHPSLPIFKSQPAQPAGGIPRSLFAGSNTDGLFSRVEANPSGPVNFIRKIPAGSAPAAGRARAASVSSPGKGRSPAGGRSAGGKGAGGAQAKAAETGGDDDREDSPFAPPWPKPGKGLYSLLPPEAEDDKHLVDDDDYEAFSSIVYDGKGNKVMENGMKV